MNALVDQSKANAVMSSVDADPFSMGAENAGQITYVKFKGASGQFLAGQDEEELEHGSHFIADIFNAKWIWQFWWDGQVLETVEEYLREAPLFYQQEPDFLPDHEDIDMTLEEIRRMQKEDPQNFRDGWSVQASFNMVPLDAPEEEYVMRLGYGVSMNAFHALRKAFGRRYKIEAGKKPIIELSANKYKAKAKGVGWRFAPVLKIVGWIAEEEIGNLDGSNADDYEDMPEKALPSPEDTEEVAVGEKPTPRGRRGARGRRLG